jgi:riboflavin kinase/FMN adenylyltransferase
MQISWGFKAVQEAQHAVALGVFDGVHLGHQKVLTTACALAEKEDLRSAALTFFPHPLTVLRPQHTLLHIESIETRLKRMAALGIQHVFAVPFTSDFARMHAETFIEQVLVKQLRIKHVVVGEGFKFGYKQSGDIHLLKNQGLMHGFSAHSVTHVCAQGVEVSSTRIRSCIQEGQVQHIPPLLGRFFSHTGTVVQGHQRGRLLGFPTANLLPDATLFPHQGVYAAWVDYAGRRYQAVVNIGTSPTFQDHTSLRVEAHLLNFKGESLYGQKITVHYVAHVRHERAFDSIDALKQAIAQDIAQAQTLLVQ